LSSYVLSSCAPPPTILSFPTRRSSDLARRFRVQAVTELVRRHAGRPFPPFRFLQASPLLRRIELVGPADDFIVKFVLFQPHVILDGVGQAPFPGQCLDRVERPVLLQRGQLFLLRHSLQFLKRQYLWFHSIRLLLLLFLLLSYPYFSYNTS